MTEPGQIALVTGATRGIGRAIALSLARDGHDIGYCYAGRRDAADDLEREISALGRRVFHRACDVADPVAVRAFVKDCEEALGPLDALVNNAGIVRDSPLVLMKPDAWDEVVGTNLGGVFNFCHSAVFGFMKRKRGVIVNLSSVAGVTGNAAQSNYAASKAGVIGFSQSLAKELAPFGVRVNVVAPGFITTDMTEGLSEKIRQTALGMIPLRRFGGVEDVAALVSFLISPRASYITGQTVRVDGGMVI